MNIVLQRRCLTTLKFAAKSKIHFIFSHMYFCKKLFDGELVHGSYQGKEVCYGCIPVKIKIR